MTSSHKRTISHSEISTALECQARHAFAYTGHLTGGQVLNPRTDRANLRAGRAWGRAVAALHSTSSGEGAAVVASPPSLPTATVLAPTGPTATVGQSAHSGRPLTGTHLYHAYQRALNALDAELDEQARQVRDRYGVFDRIEHGDLRIRLAAVLWQYARTTVPLQVTDPEVELFVPMPSRTGRARSNRFVFHGFLDGLTVINGYLWVVEYKLRDTLSDYQQIVRNRQIRRYAWAAEQVLDRKAAGVIVDECLSQPPKPARWVKGRKKGEGMVPSHAKDQLTTRDRYEHICTVAGVDVDPDTAAALGARRWHARHLVMFRRAEIEEAGRELVSSAQLIAQLDSGVLHPVRNPAPWRCNGCAFASICTDPSDVDLIDLNFELLPPKRLRGPEEEPTMNDQTTITAPERVAA